MESNRLNMTTVYSFEQLPLVDHDTYFAFDDEMIHALFEKLEQDGFTNYEDVRDSLLALEFTPQEVTDLVAEGVPITAYREWRKSFELYIVNQQYFPTECDEQDLYGSHTKAKVNKRKVLNKNNPFAEVSIENKSFLYPTKNGYSMLSFATNRHFVKKELEDGYIYATIPGFKVSRQKSRTNIDTMIASDSVSTPLPESKGDKKIIYI